MRARPAALRKLVTLLTGTCMLGFVFTLVFTALGEPNNAMGALGTTLVLYCTTAYCNQVYANTGRRY